MIGRRITVPVLLLSVAAALVLGAVNLWFGELNQDEGWYLYAARMVSSGFAPYRDFAFTQAPVMPFVYALAQPIVDRAGVAGGRSVTFALGLAASLLAAGLAARSAREPGSALAAAALALALVCVNVYHSYFTTVVKTYSLCGFFLVAALALSARAARQRSAVAGLAAGVLAMLAAGTRISAGAAVPLIALWLWWEGRGTRRAPAYAFAAGATVAFITVFVRWALAAPDGFRFGVFEYHAGRTAGSLMAALVFKAGFVSRVMQGYLVPISLGLVLLVARGCTRAEPATRPAHQPRLLLWAVVAAISAVHFIAPVPYDDYQVLVAPVFCAALASAWMDFMARDAGRARWAGALLISALLLSGAAAVSSPLNQSWFIRGRDRIWWRMKDQTDLAKLREAARWIRANSKETDALLTQDAYLAVESGRRVPRGLEMGPFSYYPEMDNARALRLHVLSPMLLGRLLSRPVASVAALSGYSFAIASPAVQETPTPVQMHAWQLVERNYQLAREMPHFGQGDTTLKLYRVRPEPAPL